MFAAIPHHPQRTLSESALPDAPVVPDTTHGADRFAGVRTATSAAVRKLAEAQLGLAARIAPEPRRPATQC